MRPLHNRCTVLWSNSGTCSSDIHTQKLCALLITENKNKLHDRDKKIIIKCYHKHYRCIQYHALSPSGKMQIRQKRIRVLRLCWHPLAVRVSGQGLWLQTPASNTGFSLIICYQSIRDNKCRSTLLAATLSRHATCRHELHTTCLSWLHRCLIIILPLPIFRNANHQG